LARQSRRAIDCRHVISGETGHAKSLTTPPPLASKYVTLENQPNHCHSRFFVGDWLFRPSRIHRQSTWFL